MVVTLRSDSYPGQSQSGRKSQQVTNLDLTSSEQAKKTSTPTAVCCPVPTLAALVYKLDIPSLQTQYRGEKPWLR